MERVHPVDGPYKFLQRSIAVEAAALPGGRLPTKLMMSSCVIDIEWLVHLKITFRQFLNHEDQFAVFTL